MGRDRHPGEETLAGECPGPERDTQSSQLLTQSWVSQEPWSRRGRPPGQEREHLQTRLCSPSPPLPRLTGQAGGQSGPPAPEGGSATAQGRPIPAFWLNRSARVASPLGCWQLAVGAGAGGDGTQRSLAPKEGSQLWEGW